MRKKMKLKKRIRIKRKIYFFICTILFFSTSYFVYLKQLSKITIPSNKYVKTFLYEGNHNLDFPYEMKDVFSNMVSTLLNISIKDPSSILMDLEEDGPISYNSKYIEDPSPKSNQEQPIIYLYNTHQLEEYQSTNQEEYTVVPNVLMASYILREKCNKLNIPTIVETSDIAELLRIQNFPYYKSYDITRDLILSAKEKNPTLKYYIDLHRDSVSKEYTTLSKEKKNYAKVLFIVGLENKNYKGNLALMESLCNEMNKDVSGICKGLYKKQGEGVNGIYNQDIDSHVILIEVGGVDNTMEEVTNTLDIFSKTIEREIQRDEK